jgi:hypothetical protein
MLPTVPAAVAEAVPVFDPRFLAGDEQQRGGQSEGGDRGCATDSFATTHWNILLATDVTDFHRCIWISERWSRDATHFNALPEID